MTGKIQTRLAALGALAALVAVLIPAGLASGSHDNPVGPVGTSDIVYLQLGNTDKITHAGKTQSITTKKNDCTAVDHLSVATSSSILVVSEVDGVSLGESKDGIGVQGPMDGSGEPCARTEARTAPTPNEAISVKLGPAVAGGLMAGWDIDFELKFNSTIQATLKSGGVALDQPTNLAPFSNGSQSDDGPDSKDGDNYRWTYVAPEGVHFDEVVFEATSGAFSLEGGADLQNNTSSNAFGAFDMTSRASQFLISSGLSCGDTHTVEDSDFPDITGVVKLHSMEFDPDGEGDAPTDWFTSNCLFKFFEDEVGAARLAFVPEAVEANARYTIEVTLDNQPITVDPDGTITSLAAVYDGTGDLSFPDETTDRLPACEKQPVLEDDPATTGVNEYTEFWTQQNVGLLPMGEDACFYQASVTPTSAGFGTEFWGIYFEDDPSWSFG